LHLPPVSSGDIHKRRRGAYTQLNSEYEARPAKIRRVRSADHALRGVTDGIVCVRDAPKQPCIVIGSFFPSWLLHISELGYFVDQVLVKHPSHVAGIHHVCGADVVIWSGADYIELVGALVPRNASITCFIDGRATVGLLDALAVKGIVDVLSTQTPRRACCGWYSSFVVVPHSEVGGVTIRVLTIVRHSKNPLVGLPLPLEVTAHRDAATVLSHATFGRYFRPKPINTLVDPLRCFNLGSILHPYYHGHGWLPSVLDRNVQVLTPVLNSITHGGQWGLRTMSCEEILLCNDIGATSVGLLMSGKPNHAFYSSLLPGKCLQAGFRALFHEGGTGDDVNRGEDEYVIREAMHEEEDDGNQVEDLIREVKDEEDHVAHESMAENGEVDDVAENGEVDDGTHSTVMAENGEVDDATVMAENDEVDDVAEKGEVDDVTHSTVDFLGIAREKRERSAAKADDAAVPEYLWVEHLFDDSSWGWDAGAREQIIKMIDWFRSIMLRRWKRNVFRSFGKHLVQRHPQLESAADTVIEIREGTSSSYIWSSKELGGKAYYRHWWLRRWSVAGPDLTLGEDVVARAS
jgi:hypothetical protein